MTEALVEVRDLTVRFAGADGPIAALNGVHFGVAAGEAVAVPICACQSGKRAPRQYHRCEGLQTLHTAVPSADRRPAAPRIKKCGDIILS
jgi:hypothetical protein